MGDYPFGEARRLRYFQIICETLMNAGVSHFDFFSDVVLSGIINSNFNSHLTRNKRSTGVMRTKAVMRNYISYLDWLKLLKREGNHIIPTSKTIYFGSISKNESFILSTNEKISFFIELLNNKLFYDFIKIVKNNSVPSDYKLTEYEDHYSETFLEWLVDFDILAPTSKQRGRFRIYNKYFELINIVRDNDRHRAIIEYTSRLLKQKVHSTKVLPDEVIWNRFRIALYKTNQYTKSELDSNLFAASPAISELQVYLIMEHNAYFPLNDLISKMENIAHKNKIIFMWDRIQNVGYIKMDV